MNTRACRREAVLAVVLLEMGVALIDHRWLLTTTWCPGPLAVASGAHTLSSCQATIKLLLPCRWRMTTSLGIEPSDRLSEIDPTLENAP